MDSIYTHYTTTFADDKCSGIMRQYDDYSKSYSKKLYLHQHITLILDSLIKLFYLILYTIFSHNIFSGIKKHANRSSLFL